MTMAMILIVDDEPMLLELFRRVLEDRHHILIAGSVGETLRILEQTTVDAVICDFRLSDGTGEDVMDWIREHRPALLARAAILSGDPHSVRATDVLKLCKPLPIKELMSLATRWFPAGAEEP